MKLSFALFAVKFSFFNRKVRKGMHKGRKEKTSKFLVPELKPQAVMRRPYRTKNTH